MKYSSKLKIGLLAGVVGLVGGLCVWQADIFKTKDFEIIASQAALAVLPQGQIVRPQTQEEVRQIYSGIRMHQMPRVFVDELPADWKIETTEDKTLFMKVVTALILRTNERIQAEKQILMKLNDKLLRHEKWTKADTEQFDFFVKKYDVFLTKSTEAKMAELLDKIEIVPPSLALAQAIYFTDWGQKNQHALYGEYGWIDELNYEPIPYESLVDATERFALEINSRSQMSLFRSNRYMLAVLIKQKPIGFELAGIFDQFMDWDPEYTDKLQKIFNLGYIQEVDFATFSDVDPIDPSVKQNNNNVPQSNGD